MGEFRVYAKLSGLVDGETPEEAQKHVQRILTHLLEPKGFSVMGVAAVAGDKIPGKLVTVEDDEAPVNAGAARLLKLIQREFFGEDVRLSAPRIRKMGDLSLHEYPLEIKLGNLEAIGRVLEVNPDLMKPGIQWSAADKEKHGFTDEPPAHMDIPEGHYGYGWQAKLELDPLDIGKAKNASGRLKAEMVRTVEQKLKGTVEYATADVSTDTENPVIVTSGLFSTPISPDEIAAVLHEKIGIRSILPKEVAETDPDEEPAEKPTPVTEKNDFSSLLGRLFK